MNQYEGTEGPSITYIKCHLDRKKLIFEYLNILEACSSTLNPEKQKVVDIEVTQAIKVATG